MSCRAGPVGRAGCARGWRQHAGYRADKLGHLERLGQDRDAGRVGPEAGASDDQAPAGRRRVRRGELGHQVGAVVWAEPGIHDHGVIPTRVQPPGLGQRAGGVDGEPARPQGATGHCPQRREVIDDQDAAARDAGRGCAIAAR
jgi:hypothetical protein